VFRVLLTAEVLVLYYLYLQHLLYTAYRYSYRIRVNIIVESLKQCRAPETDFYAYMFQFKQAGAWNYPVIHVGLRSGVRSLRLGMVKITELQIQGFIELQERSDLSTTTIAPNDWG